MGIASINGYVNGSKFTPVIKNPTSMNGRRSPQISKNVPYLYIELVECRLAVLEFNVIDSYMNSPNTVENTEIEAYGNKEKVGIGETTMKYIMLSIGFRSFPMKRNSLIPGVKIMMLKPIANLAHLTNLKI